MFDYNISLTNNIYSKRRRKNTRITDRQANSPLVTIIS